VTAVDRQRASGKRRADGGDGKRRVCSQKCG
jgi:hypothetical protein